MSLISKELFVESINELQMAEEYTRDLNNFFRSHNTDGHIFQPDCSVSVLKLLHEIFGNADSGDVIERFCFCNNFGEKELVIGKTTITTIEELYDYLVSHM